MAGRRFERARAGLARGALVDQLTRRVHLLPQDDCDTWAAALSVESCSQPAGPRSLLRPSLICRGTG
eukprot:1102484-Alexandrium_andersonii.AAC.1